ncbi:MAG TPA: MFS transporter [Anaerolineaceae bacterium]|nr:MFS transporter [Anaerolineaceae bacterium]
MKKLSAESIYYIRTATGELNSGLIFTSIWVLYYTVMQLSLIEVSVLYIVLTVSNFLLEIPTGIVADFYSRRASVIIGGMFIGLAFMTVGIFPFFTVALLAGFIEAIGDTCISGALQAWITDEVGEANVGNVFLRGRQVATPAGWVGVILSIGLAAWMNYQAPIILGGVLWLMLTIFLILYMPETNFKKNAAISRRSWRDQMKTSWATLADGIRLVRGTTTLQALFWVSLLGSAFADGFYKFSRAHVLQSFTLPTITLPLLGALKDNLWFGVLEMLQGLFCLVGAEIVRRKIKLSHREVAARTLLSFSALTTVAVVMFALTPHFGLAMATWVIVGGLQNISTPITEAWMNQNIPSKIRATLISMSSQAGMVGTLGISTGLGAIGDRFGVRRALGLSSLILLPMMVIYARKKGDTTINYAESI